MDSIQPYSSPEITLNNGEKIPQIGLGLWRVQDEAACINSVLEAAAIGYRHFDSAQIYENETYLGKALEQSFTNEIVAREDVFITTKLWNENQFFDHVIPSFEESLDNLQLDYVDLFLVHFPVTETRRPAWLKMQEIYESGRAKSIGVSNYTIKHLEELLNEREIVPAINQVEIHVYLQQKELREYCNEKGIIIEAYSPLAHGNGLDNEVLKTIANKHEKTAAQIMIKWCTQNNMVVLPKSITPARIAENIDVYDFELDDEDLELINGLEKNYRTCWDPTNVA